jgi:hypothetical protein
MHTPAVPTDRSGLSPLQRRLRAAFDTSDLSDARDLEGYADALGISVDTFQRIEASDDPRKQKRIDRYVKAVAEITGVPVAWLHDGWPAVSPKAEIDENVAAAIDAAVKVRVAAELARGGSPATPQQRRRAPGGQAS